MCINKVSPGVPIPEIKFLVSIGGTIIGSYEHTIIPNDSGAVTQDDYVVIKDINGEILDFGAEKISFVLEFTKYDR